MARGGREGVVSDAAGVVRVERACKGISKGTELDQLRVLEALQASGEAAGGEGLHAFRRRPGGSRSALAGAGCGASATTPGLILIA